MTEWRTMTLRDAGVALIDCVHKTPPAVEVGYPYVTIPQMKNGRIEFAGARRITHADFIQWTKKARPQVNDVVLSRRTNPGVTATFGENCEFALGQNLVLLRANGHVVCPEFLRWLVMSPAWWSQIEKYNNVGAVFDSLKCADVPRFELPIPPKHEQQGIAAVLSALDDKIDLNRRMNETLEATARTIFKDWFVNFGPTRAKMEGRGPYLAPEIWAVFPDRLDEEEKPESWRIAKVGSEFRLTMGQSPPGHTYNEAEDGLPFFQGRTDFGFRYPKRRMFCNAPTRIAEADDTLVSVRAPVGDLNMSWEKCCIGRGVAAVRHRSRCRGYTYYAMFYLQPDLSAFEHTGTVFGAINKAQFEALTIVAPDEKVIGAFEELVTNLDGRIRSNETESNTVTAARDLLLPKLMSGEIRMKKAEKIVEAIL